LSEVLGDDRLAILASGLFFALFHLPNTFLTAFTLGAGAISAWLYSRWPNVPVLGAMHAAVSIAIYYTLPPSITLNLRVGP
jgi:membrane protease YdiL (CAAX protease family)